MAGKFVCAATAAWRLAVAMLPVTFLIATPAVAGYESGLDLVRALRYDEAVAEFRACARQGPERIDCAYALGEMYSREQGVETDIGEAITWFEMAADGGNVRAMNTLGAILSGGEGVSPDHCRAFDLFQRAAELGHRTAQHNLGRSYFEGSCPRRSDATRGVVWLRRAADQGYANSFLWLGHAYRQGKGVERNIAEAVRWYEAAANDDLHDAYLALGDIHLEGDGVPVDLDVALDWHMWAAERGHAASQHQVGINYSRRETSEDLFRAAVWLRISERNGYTLEEGLLESIHADLSSEKSALVDITARAWLKELGD